MTENECMRKTHEVILTLLSNLGIIIFWIIGIFCADKWWHTPVAFGIGVFGTGILAALLSDGLNRLLAKAAPYISFILTIITYNVWY